MRKRHNNPVHSQLYHYLSAGYALFIAYASLSPFSGWQEQGLEFSAVLAAPLKQTYTPFDATANLLAYLPFGLLLGLSLRAHLNAGWSILLATLGGTLLSASMEYAQMYLPARVSSNLDVLTNSIGASTGALLAASIAPRAWFSLYPALWRLRLLHSRDGTDFGLALVTLWMFAQVNPSLPMLGNVFITEVARQPFATPPPEPFNWLESMAVSLNLLMLGMLLLILLRRQRHVAGALLLVLCTVALAKFSAAALLLKSWALLLWLNSEAMLGIFAGMLLVVAVSWLSRLMQIYFAAAVAVAYVVLAHGVLDSGAPSAAMRLYHWSYGHLLNYNGLSQTIKLVFPFLLLIYLWRAATRDAQ